MCTSYAELANIRVKNVVKGFPAINIILDVRFGLQII